MESQEQCDRMKQVCVDNGLPYLDGKTGFTLNDIFMHFGYYNNVFGVLSLDGIEVTEAEFLQLLKEQKDGK